MQVTSRSVIIGLVGLIVLFGSVWLDFGTGPAQGGIHENSSLALHRQDMPEAHFSPDQATPASPIMEPYNRLPLYFIENKGQVDKQVRYYVRGAGHTQFFTRQGMVVALNRSETLLGEVGREAELTHPGKLAAVVNPNHTEPRHLKKNCHRAAVVRMLPLDMQKSVRLEALEPQEYRVNYFKGNDPEKWLTNVPSFKAVVYRGAYPGIDLKFYGQGQQMEYDVVVNPGADPTQVKFAFKGIDAMEVTPQGDLALKLPDGSVLLQRKPLVYQEISGKTVAREGKFKVEQGTAHLVYGFEVASYDKAHPLVIDPVVVYSTYLGGGSDDAGLAITVDDAGRAVVTGWTQSTDFPLENHIYTHQGMKDIFVTKFKNDGSSLVFSTYLGGSNDDEGRSIAIDADGQIYLTGRTYSDNLPTTSGAFMGTKGGSFDAFVMKMDAAGGSLLFCTYLGGALEDTARGIAVDAGQNVYVTGFTKSTNFPKQAPLYNTLGGSQDAFVSKFSPTGSLLFSTYLGGANSDEAAAIAVGPAGQIYVTGNTYSANFPTASALYNTIGVTPDAFVTSIRANLSGLVFSTFLGGNASDYGNSVALDTTGHVYVGGYTYSTNFPTHNPLFAGNAGKADAFLTKMQGDGSALVYSTYLGGEESDHCYSIAVDRADEVTLTGVTASESFPTVGPVSHYGLKGPQDAFVSRFRANGQGLIYSGPVGGDSYDTGIGIAVDKTGHVCLTGQTNSVNFPIKNALYPYRNGVINNYDAFVVKIRNASLTGSYYLLLEN
jgi:hypothetical protein